MKDSLGFHPSLVSAFKMAVFHSVMVLGCIIIPALKYTPAQMPDGWNNLIPGYWFGSLAGCIIYGTLHFVFTTYRFSIIRKVPD